MPLLLRLLRVSPFFKASSSCRWSFYPSPVIDCRLVLLLLFFFSTLKVTGQIITVTGTIKDKVTKQAIPSVSVVLAGVPGGVVSDPDGRFKISTGKAVKVIRFSAIGFKTQEHSLGHSLTENLLIELEENAQQLEGVNIQASQRPRYKNRGNEAVELIRKVIAHKEQNIGPSNQEISFRQYEKLNLSISIPNELRSKSSLLSKFPFLAKTADTILQPGKTLVPVFMQEKLSQHIRKEQADKDKVKFLDRKESRIDQYFDEDGIDQYLERIYQPIDIYEHDIGLGGQKFLSPVAPLAPEFYKYFIIDSLKRDGVPVVHLMFSPRNKQDILFMGELYISLDGRYAVQHASLSINKEINLNWVKDLQIKVSYASALDGKYHISKSVMAMDLGLFKGKYSIFGEKTILNDDYRIGLAVQDLEDFPGSGTSAQNLPFSRPEELSPLEKNAYKNIDSLKQSSRFKTMMGFTAFVLSGYQKVGFIDIGPVGSFYSFNHVEGRRFRISGRTNDDFSQKVVLEGHLAYGLRDEQWKYALGATYSFKPSGVYQFPVSTFTLRHSYETQIPGQDLNFIEDDNFLLSFKRGLNDKWLYNRKWSAEYFQETKDHFSLRAGYRNQELDPAGGLVFRTANEEDRIVKSIQLSEFVTELRWAPHEQFYQGKRFRRPIRNEFPIFTLRAGAGFKGLLGGDYNYQNLSLNIFKRLYVAPFGHSDLMLEGGAVFGKVPFPLLVIHRANQTYAYQPQSYNLMNFMEFMSDRYASLHIDHAFNGFFFNKIPLVKKLQLREVASFKILYGGISAKNLPQNDPDLFRFQRDRENRQTSFALDRTPYMEGSIGISNIFKILRVDYVRRFTYLDHPDVPKWGIRARIHVDF
ncbi:hypothetical protein DBR11_01330 [Pedobacter sp. HMWF019]|uniref:DUF5686 and carboxypeptidase-like regulatory domain-containing protein n=1 Tax=Pedobacter sp. HMWF019 TaxID=2056856 RepID=UPI000D3D3B58|nr:DUF5686 and carboxypeptidase-like regulatory domain-containing protein [Pedobacter sp. HMWF019]PTT03740.1 hypothetical protein DBR11_01330 [Pedobacter sp. HMWF019]